MVFARQAHLHRASATYVLRVGPRFEQPEHVGISHFLEHMLHRGTATHPSAPALALAIERIGATLDAATGVEHGHLAATCPPESVLELVALLGEVVTSPVYSSIELERGIVREELLEDRDERGRLIDPDGIVRAQVFGDHPLGYPILGTPKTLRAFDRDGLRAHHARHYTSQSAVLALAGKLPPTRSLLAALERAFGSHPRGKRLKAASARSLVRRLGDEPSLTTVWNSASQVSLRVACLAPGRNQRDESATELLLRTIDDGTSTRLYRELCDERGLCYEVSAGYESYEGVGLVDLAAEAHEDSALSVLEQLLALLADLRREGPSPDELDKARNRARWFAERSADGPEATAEQAAMGILCGEPICAIERARRYASLATTDLARVARGMFAPGKLCVALVGPVSRSMRAEAQKLIHSMA